MSTNFKNYFLDRLDLHMWANNEIKMGTGHLTFLLHFEPLKRRGAQHMHREKSHLCVFLAYILALLLVSLCVLVLPPTILQLEFPTKTSLNIKNSIV